MWVKSPHQSPHPYWKRKQEAKMEMSRDQLNRLMEADSPTVMLCYHGIGLAHRCSDPDIGGGSLFVIRMVGHMVANPAELRHRESEGVPDHRTFSIDIPLTPSSMLEFAHMVTEFGNQAVSCVSALPHGPGTFSAPSESPLPESLRRILGIEDDGQG